MTEIRAATEQDLDAALAVERAAFGEEADVIAGLVANLMKDDSAKPLLSLLAWDESTPIGHILFTAAHLGGADAPVRTSLLAPLAVVPERQKQGIGGQLIRHGLDMLRDQGVGLVFVLGHPEYYPRHGFEPAGRLGLHAPYPIPEEHADAWMVQALRPGLLGYVTGALKCADAISPEEYWRE